MKIQKRLMIVTASLFLGGFILGAQLATATTFDEAVFDVGRNTGYIQQGTSINLANTEVIIGRVINSVLGFLGVIVLALIIYAGVLWTTARGNEQQVQKAKQIMAGGIIGLTIILTSSAVVNFVIAQIGTSLTGTPQ